MCQVQGYVQNPIKIFIQFNSNELGSADEVDAGFEYIIVCLANIQ